MNSDPTRGYAAWLITHGYDVSIATWSMWVRLCAKEQAR